MTNLRQLTGTRTGRAALVVAPSIAALAFASPAGAMLSHDAGAVPSSAAIVAAVEHSPVSALTLAEVRAAYDDVISAKSAAISALASRVGSFLGSVGSATEASRAQHVEALALTTYANGLAKALGKIPSTGLFAASDPQLAEIAALRSRIASLTASLSTVSALPVHTATAGAAALKVQAAALTTQLGSLDPDALAVLRSLGEFKHFCDRSGRRAEPSKSARAAALAAADPKAAAERHRHGHGHRGDRGRWS